MSFFRQICYAPVIPLKLTESCYWCLLQFVAETLSNTEFPLAYNDFLHAEQSAQAHCPRNMKGAGKCCFLSLTTWNWDAPQASPWVSRILLLESGCPNQKKNLVSWRCPDGFIKIKITGCVHPLRWEVIPRWWCSRIIPPALPLGYAPQQRVSNDHEWRWMGLHESSSSSVLWLKEGNCAVL